MRQVPKDESSVEETSPSIASIIVIILVTVAFMFSGWYIPFTLFSSWDVRANFGDMFGALNTFFSGLAFAGVIYTIFLQSKELQLQRRELKMTREELRRAAEAHEVTTKLTTLNFLPSITIDVSRDIVRLPRGNYEALLLYINNIGSTTAYDVEVKIIATYAQKDPYTTSNEMIKFNETENVAKVELNKLSSMRSSQFNSDDDKFILCDGVYYPILPHRRTVKMALNLLSQARQLKCLLQIRDVQGNNYIYIYEYSTDQISPFELKLQ